jgi:hypothetical protein
VVEEVFSPDREKTEITGREVIVENLGVYICDPQMRAGLLHFSKLLK